MASDQIFQISVHVVSTQNKWSVEPKEISNTIKEVGYNLFFKRSNHEESLRAVKINHNNLSPWVQSNLRVIDCTHDAAKQNEELQDRPPKQQEETYVGLPIHQLTTLTSKDGKWQIAIFAGAWCNKMVAKH